MKTIVLSLTLILAGLLLAGCTLPSSRRVVPAGQANVLQRSDLGVVTSVREVNIEGRRTGLGTLGGGMVGAAAGSGGRGVGGALVQASAAVAGAVAGQSLEEITVRLEDGSTVTVVQEASTGLFMDGDRVRVLHGGGQARVTMAVP